MNEPWAVVGLGNPGREYTHTRHNAGFMVVDHLAATLGVTFKQEKGLVAYGDARQGDNRVILAKPQTFMNKSGQAVQWISSYFHVPPEQILVLCDDKEIPFGQVRLRPEGSAGGHNGLKSIIEHLGLNFPRLRIGIKSEQPIYNLVDYVLAPFSGDERESFEKWLPVFPTLLSLLMRDGVAGCMNRYNNKDLASLL